MLNTEKEVCTCELCGKPKALNSEALINEFFLEYDAKNFKQLFWQCFVAAISSDEISNWAPSERTNLACLYTDITEFVSKLEVIHLKKAV